MPEKDRKNEKEADKKEKGIGVCLLGAFLLLGYIIVFIRILLEAVREGKCLAAVLLTLLFFLFTAWIAVCSYRDLSVKEKTEIKKLLKGKK